MNKYTPYVVFVLSVVITVFTAFLLNGWIDMRIEERFDNQMIDTKNRIERRIQAYEQVLYGGKGLFEASETVTRDEWKTFTDIQMIEERFPGIQGIGISKLIVGKDNLEIHIDQIRKEGFPDYTVIPEGEREEYHPIVYLEPVNERNKRAFGYDMYSESVRHNTIDLARDTGMTTISGKIRLVQETDVNVQAGFLMYVPVYEKGKPIQTIEQRRAAFEGFVYAPFRMDDFMKNVLSVAHSDITLVICDTDTDPQNIMYDHTKVMNINESEINHSLSKSMTIDVNQRQWILKGTALNTINTDIEKIIPIVILVIGLILSSMLFFIFHTYGKVIVISEQAVQKEKMASNRIAAIDKAKDEFAAMISHELKTPLIPISGYAELLLDGSLGNITEIQREKIQVMYENSIRLTTLIQDILDTRKIELQRLNLNICTVSIKEITKRCIDVFQPLAESRGIRLVDKTQDIMLRCDPDRILQVFNNVISNAIKFVPEKNGTISINSKNNNDTVMISIKDNGIGISKSKQEDLFKKFYQVDKSLTRKSGGTGLGLAISKGIIYAHGGDIWVESEENHGTTVYFILQKENNK